MKFNFRHELLDYIDHQYASRRMELIQLTSILDDKSRKKSKECNILSKSLAVVSYSHYEGFIKNICMAYLEFLNRKGLSVEEYNNQLTASFILSGIYKSNKCYCDSLEWINSVIDNGRSKVSFNVDKIVDTKSNLNFETLEAILKGIDIDINVLGIDVMYLDKIIMDKRNRIAHGDFVLIDSDEAKMIAQTCLKYMDSVRTAIENIVLLESYKNKGEETI